MTLTEQKKQANSMRNLKGAHHGYLVKDYRLDVREDGFVTAQIRVQTPYMDISAGELAQAVFAQFPTLRALVDGDRWYSLLPADRAWPSARIREIGVDRYTPKCPLLDVTIETSGGMVTQIDLMGSWSKGSLQAFLDRSAAAAAATAAV